MATAVASTEPAPGRWRLRLPEKLPNLQGKWLTLYTIVWAVILPLSIAGASRGLYLQLTTPSMWTPYGFATTEDSRGIHVDSVMLPAVRASGLSAGDYIVAIDDWRVPHFAPRSAARPHVVKANGAVTRFTIRKPTGELHEIRLVRSLANEEEAFGSAGLNRTVARLVSVV